MVEPRVLIVEDDSSLRANYVWILRQKGLSVDEADSLSVALSLIDRKTYNVAVIDIGLAGSNASENRDGFKVVARIRELDEGTVPVVLSSQHDTQLAADAVQRYGAALYVAKDTLRDRGLETLYAMLKETCSTSVLKPFGVEEIGHKPAIRSAASYISGLQPTLISLTLVALHPKGGYGMLTDFLNDFMTPLAPLLPRRDASAYLPLIRTEPSHLAADLWSKATGEALTLVVCASQNVDLFLSSGVLAGCRSDTELTAPGGRLARGNLTGLVFRRLDLERAAFADSLTPPDSVRRDMPTV